VTNPTSYREVAVSLLLFDLADGVSSRDLRLADELGTVEGKEEVRDSNWREFRSSLVVPPSSKFAVPI